ncbi:MAG: hypothetical protein JWO68_3542, partial [Actinomycetia bacterium]|nr:hypothetical protein [Actinomycetes bacterium]
MRRWERFLVAALVVLVSGCNGGSRPSVAVADGIEVVRGSSLIVPAVRSPEAVQAAGWQAVVSAGEDPLAVVDGYARQLLDQGFELRNVGPAACVNRWNRGQSTTQESALGRRLPPGATSIGVTCHIVGERAGRAVTLYLTPARSTGGWVLLLRRMPAKVLRLTRLGGAYRAPKGELPRVKARPGDAGVVLGSIGRPVAVLPGDRRVLDGVGIDEPWFCFDLLVGAIRTEGGPQ